MNRRQALLSACSVALAWVAGCGGKSRTDYIPAGEKARGALQTVLDAWKSGKDYGAIETPTIGIFVFEGRWRDGKKLESYEILEEIKGQDEPQFKVKLKLTGEPELTTIYHVNGINPLNVYGDDDFKVQTKTM